MEIKNKKIFLHHLATVLAFTATLGGFLFVFIPMGSTSLLGKILSMVVFLVINLGYAMYKSRPKKKLTIFITKKLKVNIFFGDLFEGKTNIVIPVNEYFDTLVDDKVISSKTLHGMLVRYIFGGNEQNLINQINEQLKNNSSFYEKQLFAK